MRAHCAPVVFVVPQLRRTRSMPTVDVLRDYTNITHIIKINTNIVKDIVDIFELVCRPTQVVVGHVNYISVHYYF